MHSSGKYCACIADIKGSREMPHELRQNVQQSLGGLLARFNGEFASALAVGLDFSGGDQVQALFRSAGSAYLFACAFRQAMAPVGIRFGLGAGQWTIRFEGDSTNKQDGSAYHNARRALDKAHGQKRDMTFFSGNEGDAYVNLLMAEECRLRRRQSVRQREIAGLLADSAPLSPALMRDRYGVDAVFFDKGRYSDAADKLGISRQSLYQQARQGEMAEQRELQAAVFLLLDDIFRKLEGCP